MPVEIHHTQPALDLVPSQYLKRNDRGILHQVTNNLAVEDLQAAVVTRISEER
jgi:hypothetical protein